jgi:uroporphyrinogen-III synthase
MTDADPATSGRPRVAVFRPDDGRLAAAESLLAGLGVVPVLDPMLAIEPTGNAPRTDAAYAILTSKTGAEIVADLGWRFDGTLCAIGERTAAALESADYSVDLVPPEFSSAGLVAALADHVPGTPVEVARSDHGSSVLLEGLNAAGAYVHETVLYGLVRPPQSGESAALAARGELDGALFTSSLTVTNFLAAAREQALEDEARAGLENAVVGTIGEPTRETAMTAGIAVDVVPETAAFEALARDVVARIES